MTETDVKQELVALERQALGAWGSGNPEPNLALLAEDVTYFDDGQKRRLDGLAAVRAYFEPFRGKPLFSSLEIADATVQRCGDCAVLTYRLLLNGNPFHTTEVFERRDGRWRIIHSHFSKAKQ